MFGRVALTSTFAGLGLASYCYPQNAQRSSLEYEAWKDLKCRAEIFKKSADNLKSRINILASTLMPEYFKYSTILTNTIRAEEDDRDHVENPRVIFVLGPPGAGKRTQCKSLVEEFSDYDHISVKDLIRYELKSRDTQWGPLIEHHIVNGTLVPIHVIMSLLLRAFSASKKRNFLIDGFPQTKGQWDAWMNVLGAEKCDIKFVLFLKCDESTSVLRCIKQVGGRILLDDIEMIEESLHSQYTSYMKDCGPVIDHFKKYGLVRQIDAGRQQQMVLDEIKSKCIF